MAKEPFPPPRDRHPGSVNVPIPAHFSHEFDRPLSGTLPWAGGGERCFLEVRAKDMARALLTAIPAKPAADPRRWWLGDEVADGVQAGKTKEPPPPGKDGDEAEDEAEDDEEDDDLDDEDWDDDDDLDDDLDDEDWDDDDDDDEDWDEDDDEGDE